MQLTQLFDQINQLQQQYGDSAYEAVYGAGCIIRPKMFFVFMNPTARNISSHKCRTGMRCPRVGFKQTRSMFYELGYLSQELYYQTQLYTKIDRTIEFVDKLYDYLSCQGVYVTNLAKCTQLDARPLKDNIFKEYLSVIEQEITLCNPRCIATFGNQVSSIILKKKISISSYEEPTACENVIINTISYSVYPTYYPVGLGYRNIAKAIYKIRCLG